METVWSSYGDARYRTPVKRWVPRRDIRLAADARVWQRGYRAGVGREGRGMNTYAFEHSPRRID